MLEDIVIPFEITILFINNKDFKMDVGELNFLSIWRKEIDSNSRLLSFYLTNIIRWIYVGLLSSITNLIQFHISKNSFVIVTIPNMFDSRQSRIDLETVTAVNSYGMKNIVMPLMLSNQSLLYTLDSRFAHMMW